MVNSLIEKAHLVAKGCTQKYGIDFEKNICLCCSFNFSQNSYGIIVEHRLELFHMDAKHTSLVGVLRKKFICNHLLVFSLPQQVCRLHRFLYDLK